MANSSSRTNPKLPLASAHEGTDLTSGGLSLSLSLALVPPVFLFINVGEAKNNRFLSSCRRRRCRHRRQIDKQHSMGEMMMIMWKKTIMPLHTNKQAGSSFEPSTDLVGLLVCV